MAVIVIFLFKFKIFGLKHLVGCSYWSSVSWTMVHEKFKNLFAGCFTLDVYIMSLGKVSWEKKLLLQESDKGQISYWSIQTCFRIMLLFGGLLTMLKKPQNCPISDFFDLTPKYFLVFLHYTDLVPPSTDPVPPSTNQYRPILTQYHQISAITALYWPSTIIYQCPCTRIRTSMRDLHCLLGLVFSISSSSPSLHCSG